MILMLTQWLSAFRSLRPTGDCLKKTVLPKQQKKNQKECFYSYVHFTVNWRFYVRDLSFHTAER